MASKIITGPRIIGALVVIALAVAILFALRKPALEVDLGEVNHGPLTVTIDDLGETRVVDLFVVSAPVTGELLRVPLKPGDRVVARRTVVAKIQPIDPAPLGARETAQAEANVQALQAQLAAARTRIAETRAQQLLAEREYQRVSALAPRGFVSQATIDRAQMSRETSRAASAEAREAADAAAHNLSAARAALIVPGSRASGRGVMEVTSPVSGHVLLVPQESERVVVAGTPLVQVGDPAKLEMVTDLLSADAVRVHPGATVSIVDWGGETPLKAHVRSVEPYGFLKISALGVEEQRVNVIIDFDDPQNAWSRLGHGYRATVRITVSSAPDVVRVPVGALFRTGPSWSVFRVDGEGRARLTRIEVGRMNDEVAEVTRGLAPGARVILHPSEKIADGTKVRQRS